MDQPHEPFDFQQNLLALTVCFFPPSVRVWPEAAEEPTRSLVELGVSDRTPSWKP